MNSGRNARTGTPDASGFFQLRNLLLTDLPLRQDEKRTAHAEAADGRDDFTAAAVALHGRSGRSTFIFAPMIIKQSPIQRVIFCSSSIRLWILATSFFRRSNSIFF
jgi:hypothetical protein